MSVFGKHPLGPSRRTPEQTMLKRRFAEMQGRLERLQDSSAMTAGPVTTNGPYRKSLPVSSKPVLAVDVSHPTRAGASITC